MAGPSTHASWRLLPSEQVLWQGQPVKGIPRGWFWVWMPWLCHAMAAVAGAFAGLMWLAEMPGFQPLLLMVFYLVFTGAAFGLAPRYLLDPCEFLVTDRRVIWQRGRMRRSMERHGITYARIRWHRSAAGVGDLELVRAVPFGPLRRRQRLTFHDIETPDLVFARIRDAQPGSLAGDGNVPLTDRLDVGERVVWGGGPEGWLLGWRELWTGLLGVGVWVAAAAYAHRLGGLLLSLEHSGLSMRSLTWLLLFVAFAVSLTVMLGVALALSWWGWWNARALGHATEYVLTDRRLLIRRGHTELSLDRRRIVDVADLPSGRGSRHLVLLLDGPQGRALDDSGALGPLLPPRGTVPPVLYEVRDSERVRKLLLDGSGSSVGMLCLIMNLAWSGCGGTGTEHTATTRSAVVAAAPTAAVAAGQVHFAAEAVEVDYQCTEGSAESCDGLDTNCDGVIDGGCGYASGPLQVTVAWSGTANLDLRVHGPEGQSVGAGMARATGGLRLDRVAQGACGEEAEPPHIENVYALPNELVPGSYRVELAHVDTCGGAEAPTAVSVSIALAGQVHGPYNVTLVPSERREVARIEIPDTD